MGEWVLSRLKLIKQKLDEEKIWVQKKFKGWLMDKIVRGCWLNIKLLHFSLFTKHINLNQFLIGNF